jgi:hypothetical protein
VRSRSLSALDAAELQANAEAQEPSHDEAVALELQLRQRSTNEQAQAQRVRTHGAESKEEEDEDSDAEKQDEGKLHVAVTAPSSRFWPFSLASSPSPSASPDVRNADECHCEDAVAIVTSGGSSSSNSRCNNNARKCNVANANAAGNKGASGGVTAAVASFLSRALSPSPAALNASAAAAASTVRGGGLSSSSSYGATLKPPSLPLPPLSSSSSSPSLPRSSSSSLKPSSSYRAPLSTFLPLPVEVDELNFANLLDRQLRDQVRERMRSAWRLGLLAAQEEAQAQFDSLRAMLPPALAPYATASHLGRLGALGATLLLAQLAVASPHFLRSSLSRSLRAGRDVAFFAAAVVAAATAYRELHSSLPEGSAAAAQAARALMSGSLPPSDATAATGIRRGNSAEQGASSSSSSPPPPPPPALLPSLATFQRVHALSSSSASSVAQRLHELSLLLRWLRLRLAASKPLRLSGLVLALWLAWLGRHSGAAQSFRAFLAANLRSILQKLPQSRLPALVSS